MRHPGFALALFSALLALLAAPAGCGDRTIDSICHQSCDCSPCTRTDLDACVTKGQTAEATAQKKNCEAQFDTLLSCFDENLSCQAGEGAGTTECSKQEAMLMTCAGIGNPFTTPCQEAAQKSAGCSGSTVQNTAGSCPAVSACQSLCVLAQPCEVINGQTFSQDFQDCENQCINTISGSGGSFGGTSPPDFPDGGEF